MTTTSEEDKRLGEEFDKALDEALISEGITTPKVTERDIEHVIGIMKKEAPYDETSIKQIFFGCASAFTKLPIHHNVNSRKSGSGKSYMLVLVSGYFPNRYVLAFVGMSDKALVHEQGIQVIVDEEKGSTILVDPLINDIKSKIEELENRLDDPKLNPQDKKEIRKSIREHKDEIKDINSKAEKLIVLDNRIILLLDTAQEGLYNTMMSVISQDSTRDQIYQFTDKQGGAGKLGATKNRLRGTPALFTAQVIDDSRQLRYQEKNRRFIHVTPDTSSAKVNSAKSLIGQKYGLIPEEYDDRVISIEDKERAKEIISILVDKLIDHSKLLRPKESGIKIPFTEAINQGIGGDETEWSMTVMDRTMRYLTIITKVNMDSRPKIVDSETGKSYPISTFKDLKETLELMNVGASILRPYIGHWYNTVFIPLFKELDGKSNIRYTEEGAILEKEQYVGLTTEQLANATFDKLKMKINTDGIRKQFIYPLLNLGIINTVKSVINRNEMICFPVEDGSVFNIFDDGKDHRLKLTNLDVYPSKKVLEEDFRTFIKQDVSEGVQKFLINLG